MVTVVEGGRHEQVVAAGRAAVHANDGPRQTVTCRTHDANFTPHPKSCLYPLLTRYSGQATVFRRSWLRSH